MNINSAPEWRKSSYCGNAACVEVAMTSDAILVRDARNPQTRPLTFTIEEWTAFVAGVKAGEFD